VENKVNGTKEKSSKKRMFEKTNDSKRTLFRLISVRLVGFAVLAALLAGGTVSVMAVTFSKNAIRQEIIETSHTKAEVTAQFTAFCIETIQANVNSFSIRPSLSNYIIENNDQAASKQLAEFINIQKALDTTGLYDANGIEFAFSDPNATTVGQSFADREGVNQVKSTKLPFQSVPIKSRTTGKAVAPYVVPILDNQNQLIGILSGAISLEKLSAIVVKASIASDSNLVVIDLRNGGSIIAHREPQMILTPVAESYADVINLMVNGESGAHDITNQKGEEELIGFAPIPNLPWGVMVVTLHKDAFLPVSALSQVLSIISAIIVLITASLSVFLVLQLTRPIGILVKETMEIGKGNLDYPISTTETNEIGDLSRAFSDMARNLKTVVVSNDRLKEEVEGRKIAEERLAALNATLEQKVAERTAQLEVSNKELESFSYSVSHDLRAPLRHVGGFVELLKEHLQETLDDQSWHYIEVITKATNDMGQLIDDLLSYSRIGKTAIKSTNVDLNLLIKQVLETFEPEMENRTIEWDISILPNVHGDTEMLRLALSNLIANALKFTSLKTSAKIEIGSIHDPENANQSVFYIKDNGAGFDMQYKDKLFEVFQRLHSQKEFPGTGIGLANVKRVIQRHGGKVWAEGVPKEGAVFYFTLPKIRRNHYVRTETDPIG
jgi:signal transduction histidine kinase